MHIPSNVIDTVDICSRDNDVEEATRLSLAAIKKLDNYNAFVESLIYNAVRDLVYDSRHKMNVRIKRDTGRYHTSNKTTKEIGEANKYYASYLEYKIDGRDLGSLYGRELLVIAERQRLIGEGFLFNHQLLFELKKVVKDNVTVTEALAGSDNTKEGIKKADRKLAAIFEKVWGKDELAG